VFQSSRACDIYQFFGDVAWTMLALSVELELMSTGDSCAELHGITFEGNCKVQVFARCPWGVSFSVGINTSPESAFVKASFDTEPNLQYTAVSHTERIQRFRCKNDLEARQVSSVVILY